MNKQPKYEWRVICAQHGNAGHTTHAWTRAGKDAKAKTIKSRDYMNENNPRTTHWYRDELPYRVQRRPLVDWEEYGGDDGAD